MDFTPGPWFAEWDEWGEIPFYAIRNGNGKQIAVLPYSWRCAPPDQTSFNDERDKLTQANAMLIAAAPELLAALKEVIGYGSSISWGSAYDDAVDLIAKAEGE